MIVNQETIKTLASQGKRLDGRGLQEYRQPLVIETGISWTAEGSCRVQIGETVVLVGVKLAIEKPYPDTPNEGGIMVNAELTPLSSAEYEPGPPGMKAIELARVTDRGIREAKAIDLKKLCLVPREKAWFITIDIVTLNDAGNLFDAAGLAALTALRAAKFPYLDPETGIIDYKKKTDVSLPLTKEPIPITIYKINGKLVVDPTAEEEKVAEVRLTVASDSKNVLSALQKGGEGPLAISDVSAMIDLAFEKAKMLREVLHKNIP